MAPDLVLEELVEYIGIDISEDNYLDVSLQVGQSFLRYRLSATISNAKIAA